MENDKSIIVDFFENTKNYPLNQSTSSKYLQDECNKDYKNYHNNAIIKDGYIYYIKFNYHKSHMPILKKMYNDINNSLYSSADIRERDLILNMLRIYINFEFPKLEYFINRKYTINEAFLVLGFVGSIDFEIVKKSKIDECDLKTILIAIRNSYFINNEQRFYSKIKETIQNENEHILQYRINNKYI